MTVQKQLQQTQVSHVTKDSNGNKLVLIAQKDLDSLLEHILEGRYSMASLEMLKLSGENPQDYIPYRTYNRLLKTKKSLANGEAIKEKKRNTGR